MLDRPLTCPACGHKSPIINMIEDQHGRAIIRLLVKLPEQLEMPLMRYLDLFKPEKQGLRWSVGYSRLQQIELQITSRRVERKGNTRAAPVELWVACLDELINNTPASLVLPLRGHGYLLEMVFNQAEQAAAREEEAGIHKARHRVRDTQDEDQSFQTLADIALGNSPDQPERGSESEKHADKEQKD